MGGVEQKQFISTGSSKRSSYGRIQAKGVHLGGVKQKEFIWAGQAKGVHLGGSSKMVYIGRIKQNKFIWSGLSNRCSYGSGQAKAVHIG